MIYKVYSSRFLLACLLLLDVVDIASTLVAWSRGYVELNPVIHSTGLLGLVLLKLPYMAVIWLAWRALVAVGYPRLARVTVAAALCAGVLVGSVVDAHNILLLTGGVS